MQFVERIRLWLGPSDAQAQAEAVFRLLWKTIAGELAASLGYLPQLVVDGLNCQPVNNSSPPPTNQGAANFKINNDGDQNAS